MSIDLLIRTLLCLADAQRAMSLSVLVAGNPKIQSRHFTLINLTPKFTMPQNIVYAWTQIPRNEVRLEPGPFKSLIWK